MKSGYTNSGYDLPLFSCETLGDLLYYHFGNTAAKGGPLRIDGIDPGIEPSLRLVEADRGKVHMITYGAVTTPAGLPLSGGCSRSTGHGELLGKLMPACDCH
jgi:hypothetical protein